MKKIENQCVDCGLPCIGKTCPYYGVVVFYCDICENTDAIAEYTIDDMDMCESCAKTYLLEQANDCTVEELADILNIDIWKKS